LQYRSAKFIATRYSQSAGERNVRTEGGKHLNKDWTTDVSRFFSHLSIDSTDRVIVILKGHLLVEELLREYVNFQFPQPKALLDARLTFQQNLCLAKALIPTANIGQLTNIRFLLQTAQD